MSLHLFSESFPKPFKIFWFFFQKVSVWFEFHLIPLDSWQRANLRKSSLFLQVETCYYLLSTAIIYRDDGFFFPYSLTSILLFPTKNNYYLYRSRAKKAKCEKREFWTQKRSFIIFSHTFSYSSVIQTPLVFRAFWTRKKTERDPKNANFLSLCMLQVGLLCLMRLTKLWTVQFVDCSKVHSTWMRTLF